MPQLSSLYVQMLAFGPREDYDVLSELLLAILDFMRGLKTICFDGVNDNDAYQLTSFLTSKSPQVNVAPIYRLLRS